MSDTDPDTLPRPGLSDSGSECPGRSRVESANQQSGINTCPHSVNTGQILIPAVIIGSITPTRWAHYKGNRGGHVQPEEAGSVKGGQFIKTPTLTSPQINTPPTLSCHRGWAMGRGRGVRLEGTKIATLTYQFMKFCLPLFGRHSKK